MRKSAKCDFFLNLMKKSLTFRLWRVGDILFVVFTERGEIIRIISARLATEAERRLYYDKEISSY